MLKGQESSRRTDDDATSSESGPKREPSAKRLKLFASILGLLGTVLSLAVPFVPVSYDITTLKWPTAEGTKSVSAPLVAYSPVWLNADVPCTAVRSLDARTNGPATLLSTNPPSSDYGKLTGLILQVIEAGVMGVIFPHIDTKEQALHAIREVKYPPVGNRGFGDSARASKFGFLPTEQFLDYVNENVMVIGMIESREGIRNLDEILSTGIDVLRIGAKDLSLDMGYGGVVTPEVKETVKEVCRRIRDSKVILGDAGLGGLTSQEDFDELCALGCRMFTVGSDMACVKQAVVGKRKSFDAFKQTHFAEK